MRRHITYANVVATIALFGMIAGGTAIAVTKIGSNAIKRGAVTKPKLAKNAVGAKKLGRVQLVEGDEVSVPSGSQRFVEVECKRKARVLSGGALQVDETESDHELAMTHSGRTTRRIWTIGVANSTPTTKSWVPQALCLRK